MKRVAVIDLGTQSVLYILVRRDVHGRLSPEFQETASVRLGQGVTESGAIAEAAVLRLLPLLNRFTELSAQHRAERIRAVGTRVFRMAANRTEVIERIRQETGLNIEILSEKEEAFYSFQGAVYGRSLSFPVTVIDIGGGSTEIIAGSEKHIDLWHSFPLGAVSLRESCGGDAGHEKADTMIAAGFEVPAVKRFRTSRLVGVGGTVTTLAALDLGLVRYDPERVDGCRLKREQIEIIFNKLIRLSPRQARSWLAVDPERADILEYGVRVLMHFMKNAGFPEVLISDRGLRLGVARQEFEKDNSAIL